MIFLFIYIIAIILIPCYISADNAILYITLIIVCICHISLKRTPWEGLSGCLLRIPPLFQTTRHHWQELRFQAVSAQSQRDLLGMRNIFSMA